MLSDVVPPKCYRSFIYDVAKYKVWGFESEGSEPYVLYAFG